MTNREKYKDEIIRLALDGCLIGKSKGLIVACESLHCKDCDFSSLNNPTKMVCPKYRKWWLDQEDKPTLTKQERAFIDCIIEDFYIERFCDGTLWIWDMSDECNFELDESLFKFIEAGKSMSKKELLSLEVE